MLYNNHKCQDWLECLDLPMDHFSTNKQNICPKQKQKQKQNTYQSTVG
jgi:hypothetical protein